MLASELHADMPSAANSFNGPEQLLEAFMALDATNLLVFVEKNRSEPLIQKQFDEMLQYVNRLDEVHLYQLIDRAFQNGWPSHIVDGLFGRGLASQWRSREPSASSLLTHTGKAHNHPGTRSLIFRGAMNHVASRWSDAEYELFFVQVIAFATNSQISYASRSSVVDGLYRFFEFEGRMIAGESVDKTNKRFQNLLDGVVLSLAREAKSPGSAAYALTRDSIRGLALMKGRQSDGENIAEVRDEIVRVLLDPRMPKSSAREILRAGVMLDLKQALTPRDVERLGGDPRLADEASQEMLKALAHDAALDVR